MADKAMKSLEEVIKYKLKFLPAEIEPFYAIQTYRARRGPNPPPSHYDIYRTKNTIFSNDSFSFIEEITPLFIYISSCDKYYRENGHGKIEYIDIFLFMVDGEILKFGFSFDYEEHRIFKFKENKCSFFSSVGYCVRYIAPFKILFRGLFNHFLTEEERLEQEREAREAEEAYFNYYGYTTNNREEEPFLFQRQRHEVWDPPNNDDSDSGDNDNEENLQIDREIQEEVEASQSDSDNNDDREIQEEVETSQSDSDDSDDEEKEELSINDFKTFKLEQCVICLEEEPKVLFCNCGHLCICEKCLVHRHDDCPVCEKENTILRIIE